MHFSTMLTARYLTVSPYLTGPYDACPPATHAPLPCTHPLPRTPPPPRTPPATHTPLNIWTYMCCTVQNTSHYLNGKGFSQGNGAPSLTSRYLTIPSQMLTIHTSGRNKAVRGRIFAPVTK